MATSRFQWFARYAVVFAFAGCKPHEPPPSTPSSPNIHGSETWLGGPQEKEKGVPGIDYARISWWTWNDRLILAVWMDRAEGGGSVGFNGNGTPEGYTAEFHVTKTDGFFGMPGVAVHCTSKDGRSGPLIVNDEKFDLSQGSLLLVSRSSGKVRPKLLNRPDSPVPFNDTKDANHFEKLKKDPEIVPFFNPKKAP